MKNKKILIVFVHGWSVTDTDTYGQLPERLKIEADNAGLNIEIEEIFLGRYISFHDEVRLQDIARAFESAVSDVLAPWLKSNTRFVCITHSTGGPVIREWWQSYYQNQNQNQNQTQNKKAKNACPMSHLIMLAPANYGSALAQLGKGRLSRMKFWFGGVEPGQGVLDWLSLGSLEAWNLNINWINSKNNAIDDNAVFPFVITGQTIDRKFYDHLNTYTGESGSDGVVRVAAANLQSSYLHLVQQEPQLAQSKKNSLWIAPQLAIQQFQQAPQTALAVIKGKSHSGKDLGIMRSVKKSTKDQQSQQTIQTILNCININKQSEYSALISKLNQQTELTQAEEKLEVVKNLLLSDSYYIHDRYSMVIFKISDHLGFPINDFDLVLTGGDNSDPNGLPAGFFVDKQRNNKHPNMITFYFNYDLMIGAKEVKTKDGKVIRQSRMGIEKLGLKIYPRPNDGFVFYLPCEINASKQLLEKVLQPNSTTLIDICLQRVVYKNVMQLDQGTKTSSFVKQRSEGDIAI